IGRLKTEVADLVDEVLGDVAARGECDLVEDIAGEMPVRVIMRMLGIPESDWERLRELVWRWRVPADPRWAEEDRETVSTEALQAVLDYCTELAIERRREPRDDFATIVGNLEF